MDWHMHHDSTKVMKTYQTVVLYSNRCHIRIGGGEGEKSERRKEKARNDD